jgi:hypothetical protein
VSKSLKFVLVIIVFLSLFCVLQGNKHKFELQASEWKNRVAKDTKSSRDEALINAIKIWNNKISNIEFELKRGTDPNVRDREGTPALFYVQNLETARLLKKYGVNIFAWDRKGRTFLHAMAIQVRNRGVSSDALDTLKFGLRMGLDPHVKDKSGESAWDFMQRYFCGKQIAWDRETLLLVEDRRSPLLAKEWETFDCEFARPVIRVVVCGDSPYEANWEGGYTWQADSKERLIDGRIRLMYRGEIGNPGASLTSTDLDFNSCREQNGNWTAKKKNGEPVTYPSPLLRLQAIDSEMFRPDAVKTYPTAPNDKNLQPDGRVILGCQAELKQVAFSQIISGDYIFDSFKIRYGRWVARKRNSGSRP